MKSLFIKTLVVSCFFLLSGFSVLAGTYDVGSGTFTASDEFVFKHTGTKDSFAGTLTRKSDGFTLYFDIGKMAGTQMHDGKKDQCTYFRKHSIGGLPVITGIEAIPDGKRIVTTVAYDPKTDLDPANFWVAIHKDTDIADFLLIATTYQAKSPAPARPEKPEASPLKSPQLPADDSPQTLAAAAKMGAETAAADIKAGTFRILEYGEPRQITEDTKDPQTGYRILPVAGCKVTKTLRAEADAYNQAMRDWHAKNPGPPKP